VPVNDLYSESIAPLIKVAWEDTIAWFNSISELSFIGNGIEEAYKFYLNVTDLVLQYFTGKIENPVIG
jgi:hypothetical protein